MEPFIVGIDITSTKDLFGRNREIETLISCAKRKGNAGIIGARRFGKTCLMKSLETYLVNNSSIGAYPLYFDVRKILLLYIDLWLRFLHQKCVWIICCQKGS